MLQVSQSTCGTWHTVRSGKFHSIENVHPFAASDGSIYYGGVGPILSLVETLLLDLSPQ